MVCLLVRDVADHRLLMTGTNRKNSVASLPVKLRQSAVFLMNPFGGTALDFPNHIRYGDGSGERKKQTGFHPSLSPFTP